MIKPIHIFIFFLGFFILTASFSLQYYVNNKSYYNFVEDFTWEQKVANITFYEESVKQAEMNLNYNPLLIRIFYFSITMLCVTSIYIWFNHKDLPKRKV